MCTTKELTFPHGVLPVVFSVVYAVSVFESLSRLLSQVPPSVGFEGRKTSFLLSRRPTLHVINQESRQKKLSTSLFFFPPVYFCRCRFRPKRATRADVHICDTCECVTRACDPTCVRYFAPARASKKWTLRVYIDNRSEMHARWSF